MKTNVKRVSARTHEGAPAKTIDAYRGLRRSILACMLWEDQFYEDGKSIADRISELAKQCTDEQLKFLSVEARTNFKLRHAPLMLLLELISRGGNSVADAIYETINRPDEISELISLYWRNGKRPLSAQMKKGLARAFGKFNEYQLAKYNSKDAAIKLRDALFLSHAKPKDEEQAALYKRLANNQLAKPDTWESRMAGGEDKKTVFTDLLERNKLGYMALLRNLRGMSEAGVEHSLIKRSLVDRNPERVLPFRFISALNSAPQFARELGIAMQKCMEQLDRLPGRTVVLVDTSGSMDARVSGKSDISRRDAASALAILLVGICDEARVFVFSDTVKEIPAFTGLALKEQIDRHERRSTDIRAAVMKAEKVGYDRLVVFTDEQSQTPVPDPVGRGYMINVASYKNGVGYGKWLHVDGFSEAVIDFIREYEVEKL